MLVYTRYSHEKLINSFLLCIAIILFFSGAFRSNGPDIINYKDFYYNSPERIPDILFYLIFSFFSFIGFKFEVILLLMMLLTLVSIKRITQIYKVSFLFTFCIYFIYLIPVRDLAQFRTGLAISILLIAFSFNGKKFISWPLYCAAVLCHYTAVVLVLNIIGSYLIASFQNKYLRQILLLSAVIFIFIVGLKIEQLAFIDQRISIYLSYASHVDGRPVQSMTVAIYYSLITLSFIYFAKNEMSQKDYRSLIYMMIFAISIFFAFSNIAIFSYRLAHVAAALHPIMVAIIFKSIRKKERSKSQKILGILVIGILTLIYISKISIGSIVYDIEFSSSV